MKSIIKLFILLNILVACSPSAPLATVTPTLVPSLTSIPSAISIPSETPTLTSTITLNILDASLWTPLPTLMSNDADMAFRNWFKGTSSCSFPCWAGIVPGETSWAEAVQALTPILNLHIAENPGKCRFGPCEYLAWQYDLEGNLYDGNLYSKNNTVYAVFLEGDILLEYAMRDVFVKYGQPTQVYIYTNPYTLGELPQLDLVALYPKNKFAVRYIWQAQVQDQNIVACGKPYVFMLGIVAIDASQWTGLEIDQAGRQLDNGAIGDGGLRPIADVLNISTDVFYHNVLDNSKSSFCITTPIKYWN